MARDRYERRHRRTAKNAESSETMAGADFDAVPSLAEAMGLEQICDRCGTPGTGYEDWSFTGPDGQKHEAFLCPRCVREVEADAQDQVDHQTRGER